MQEKHLRALIDTLPLLLWLKDSEGRFLAVNRSVAEAAGVRDAVEMIGKTDLDFFPAELAEAYQADDREVLRQDSRKTVQEPLAGAEGRRWIETCKQPARDRDGTLIGSVGFARDITEAKSLEHSLEESRARWEHAVRAVNDGIWDWNVGTGALYVSERCKEMLGYPADAPFETDAVWRGLLHPEDAERVMLAMTLHFEGELSAFECEYRMRCQDGSYKWILSRGQAEFDAEGRVSRMIGSNTDITTRHRAEVRLSERSEQLNAIFALSPDGFVSFDAAHRVNLVNPAFLRMTGLTERTLLGLSEDAFCAALAARCSEGCRFPGFEALRKAGETGTHQQIEIAGPGKTVLEIGLRQSQTTAISQILYLRDVTHEVEVDRMKSEFLSTAAHELRTPMANIYGYAELLSVQDFDEATRREFVAVITRHAGLMSSIINELLDLARIEARRGKDFVFERIDLRGLVDEAVRDFNAPGERQPPRLHLPRTPTWVRADRKKILQTINNVLSNAYKYSPDGGDVDIGLVLGATSGGGTEIGIEVRDAGIGLTPEQLARVCERFYRADTSGKIPGTGLGMSIVKEIIDLHGGHLSLQSQLGIGTQVTLWLPAAAHS